MRQCKEEMPLPINTVVSWLSWKEDFLGRAVIYATLLGLREWVGCFGGLASPTPIWTHWVFIKCSNKCSALPCFLIMERSSSLISLR